MRFHQIAAADDDAENNRTSLTSAAQ